MSQRNPSSVTQERGVPITAPHPPTSGAGQTPDEGSTLRIKLGGSSWSPHATSQSICCDIVQGGERASPPNPQDPPKHPQSRSRLCPEDQEGHWAGRMSPHSPHRDRALTPPSAAQRPWAHIKRHTCVLTHAHTQTRWTYKVTNCTPSHRFLCYTVLHSPRYTNQGAYIIRWSLTLRVTCPRKITQI